MCGIAGIFNTAGNPVNTKSLRIMNEAIRHRGPDDSGSVVFSGKNRNLFIDFNRDFEIINKSCTSENELNIGFTHRRLSIIDLSVHGHQPMSDDENKVRLIFNGEIYNFLTIRNELEKIGYKFKSRTDSEVVLYAYKEYGISFISKLSGMFAFAIWDAEKKELYLVRDRIGKKPIYYSFVGDELIFASEIKALLQIPELNRKLNKNSLSYYLSYLAIPAPDTLFENIFKVSPGTYLKISGKNNIEKVKYWDAASFNSANGMTENEIISKTETLLENAVEKRMMSDVPFGVFLSGGVDSSLIVAMMSKMTATRINTFTIGYKGFERSNEFQYAKRISQMYNCNHHELIIDVSNAKELIKDMVYYQDEPIADPVCIPILLLARKAKETGISVIQVGEGADEIFAGYRNFNSYYKINKYFWKNKNLLPKFLQKSITPIGKSILSHTKLRKYQDYFDFMRDDKELYWNNSHQFYPSDIKRILTYNNYCNSYNFVSENALRYDVMGKERFLGKLAYQELNLRLPELLLMRVDKMTMAASLEARVPFLDYELVEFSMSIDDKLKLKNNETKYIVKKIAEKYLPSDIIYRKKVGFGFPIKHFFKDEFDTYLKENIYNSKLAKEEIINYSFVNEMFSLSKSGKVNYHSYLWSLANLSMWYDLWF